MAYQGVEGNGGTDIWDATGGLVFYFSMSRIASDCSIFGALY
jgi:hypothetical protein